MSRNMGDIDRLSCEGTLHDRSEEEFAKLLTDINIAVDNLKFIVYQINNGIISEIDEVREEVNSVIAELSPFVPAK